MFQLRRILVPMDDSDLSTRALDAALTLAAGTHAHIWPVFVRKVPTGDDVAYMDDLDAEATLAALRGEVEERLRDGHGVPAERLHPELRTGSAEACILEAAADHDVDLIVMGTHGRSGVADRVFGSTTERVLAHGRWAMLILRDPVT